MICKECGKRVNKSLRYPSLNLIAKKLCFACDFWTERLGNVNSVRSVRVDGSHYWIGKEAASPSSCRGFGSRLFKIKFNDGRIVDSTNLWHQGEIPEHFKSRLRDNAEFLES